MAGSPVYLDVKNLNPNADPVSGQLPAPQPKKSVFSLKKSPKPAATTETGQGEQQQNIPAEKVNNYNGIVYNLPAKSSIRVYTSTQVYVDEVVPMPQFGKTETLSSKLFGKKATTKVQLNPITGALLRIEE